jgi:molybdopterin/thiamine biosynthesis adenylyltransferase
MIPLNDEEKATYEWQMWERGFGEEGQTKLRNSAALVSRVGGLGGPVAQELAAAGIGKLILAHGGNLKHSDLNRQILMRHDALGTPRVECAKQSLLDLNPRLEVVTVPENISDANAADLVDQVDIVFDCAPLFQERFAMNAACVAQGKPLIDCAMFSLEGQVTTILPGETPCLACVYPELPAGWKREFPVFGAVSATAACLGVMEGIKVLTGFAEPSLAGRMLYYDLRTMQFQKIPLMRRADCPVCAHLF